MEKHLLIALGATIIHLIYKDRLFDTELTKKGILTQLGNIITSSISTWLLHLVMEMLLKDYHETQPSWLIIGSLLIGLLGSGIISGILAVKIDGITTNFIQGKLEKFTTTLSNDTPKGDSTP